MPTAIPDATITFPMLGDWFSFSASNYFTIFGHKFYWYGVIIALGFLLAVLYCSKRSDAFGITGDDLFDTLLVAVPMGIVGARLYYVLFDLPQYLEDPISIFKIWEGGLAIYGGIILSVVGGAIVARVKKFNLFALLDLVSFGFLIGQTMGRWGNFMNREAFGTETDVFCRMGLTPPGGETIYVHPTFLYESCWNLVGFLFLHIYSKKRQRKFDGQLFLMYVAWYGLGRFMIEGLRTDSLWLIPGVVRVSQLLAGVSCIVALILLVVLLRRSPNPEMLWVNRRAVLAGAVAGGSAEEVQPTENPEDTSIGHKDDTTIGDTQEEKGENSKKV